MKQTENLTRRQLYSLELLRLSTPELEAYLRELAQENPLVELEEEVSSDTRETAGDDLLGRLRWLEDNDRQNWFYQQFTNEELSSLARVSTDGGLAETLVSFLSRQLERLKLAEEDARPVRYLIGCLDDDGYLRTPLEELSRHGFIPLPRLERAREVLLTLEPAGVGAAGLSQCLALQLERIGETGPALAIAQNYLEALAGGRDEDIANKLGVTRAQVEQARRTIRELDPRPGAVFQPSEQVYYAHPDLLAEERDGSMTVRLARGEHPPFRVSGYYREMLEKTEDREVRDYLTDKLSQAEDVMWAIRQREAVLLKCVQVIVDRQGGFFRSGPAALHPLALEEIARAAELPLDTVSRAVREKYLQCAWGLYPLSRFVSRASLGRSGLGE